MLRVLQLLTLVLADKELKYKFFENFGQVFHDYTENGFDGINGAYRAEDPMDTIPTDRGAYFYGGDKEINVPLSNSEDEELIEESKFSVALWVNIQTSTSRVLASEDSAKISNIFMIAKTNGVQFGIYLLSNFKIQVTIEGSNGMNIFYSDTYIFTNTWQFIGISVKTSEIRLYLNQVQNTLYSGSFNYEFNGATGIYIGHQDSVDSFNGLLFSFTFDESELVIADFIQTSSSVCYTLGCSTPCTPAVVIENIPYCISITPEYTKDYLGLNCPTDCKYGCKNSICLECECNYLTCIINNNNMPKCWCPTTSVSNSTSCTCNESSKVFNGLTCEDTSSCNTLCLGCEDSICLYCKDLNGSPSGSTCNCPTNYYAFNYISSTSYCSKCPETCLTCDSTNECQSCISEHAEVNEFGNCECNLGYYSLDSLVNADSCSECYFTCESCEEYPKCSTCKTKYANPDSVNGCSCPSNSTENNSSCECSDGYYISYHSSTYRCNECHSTCLTCNQTGKLGCLTCQPGLNYTDGLCACDQSFYWNGTNCESCEENCEICTSGSKCNQCVSGFYLNYQNHCEKNCSVSSYYDGEDCVLCKNLCYECDENGCLKCSQNSELENGVCKCEQGFSGDLVCEQQYFSGGLIINMTNIIFLQFEKTLQTQLTIKDFSLNISESHLNYHWMVSEPKTQVFKFKIIPNSNIPNGTQVLIEIVNNYSIYSIESYKLLNKVFIGELKEYNTGYSSSLTTQRLANITSGLAKAAISSSALSGVLSTPAFLWSFLNTMELIALLPLNAIPYPSTLTEFFNSFVGFSIFPNPMEYIQSDANLPDAYREAKKYGFNTSLCLYNGGTYIWIFGFFLFVMLLSYLGQKSNNQHISYYSQVLFKKFFYSFFLRFWIQSQLDLGIISMIQLYSIYNDSGAEFYVNLVFSVTIMVKFI